MAEALDDPVRRGFHRRDPRWLSVVYQRLRARARGKAPFVAHQRLDDFRTGLDEHHLIEYADHRGVRCRCIGHGSLPYQPPDRRRQRHPAEIVRWETRVSPLQPSRGIHGFALLTFDGPVLEVEHVDEAGGTAWQERWS